MKRQVFSIASFEQRAKPEIADDPSFPDNQDIVWFDVAMNGMPMEKFESADKPSELSCIYFR